ncbi:prolipoprotein diacylglyceryl transferase [Candidatus Deianiraea vastatrix]|uniref:Phosphatidylglycerol--prolipoprotein diacylglyceryl transferase n=1 Tax=Candidatus Deianiraea vastatrix TaxID=2163644 RepID=A0A5B8XER4_9RICK|nr:prolipoprotein diacylglyceryl transferase [Candidatus Deianiraea vastatrix]QED23753.1 Prolipoprotein diacylglyceryl transferase [Candidatus Deianiraea vastatrix]
MIIVNGLKIYSDIDPVLISFGSIKIHYYSFAYIFGLLIIPYYVNRDYLKSKELTDKFSTYIVLCVILCARLFYVLFYNFSYYINNSLLDIFKTWEGGMSFHGGLIGFILGVYLFSKKYDKRFFAITDICAVITPLCLGIGRIMNFINGELYGRPTDQTWGVMFSTDNTMLLRHPSQLYQSFFEGFILFFIMLYLKKQTNLGKKEGYLSLIFVSLYAIFRFFIEFFRNPDEQLGLFFNLLTMGQVLCIAMILFISSYLTFTKIIKKT